MRLSWPSACIAVWGYGGAHALPPFDKVTSSGQLSCVSDKSWANPKADSCTKYRAPENGPGPPRQRRRFPCSDAEPQALGQFGTDPLLWASLHLADQELQRRLESKTPISMQPGSLARSLPAHLELTWTWAKIHGQGCTQPQTLTCQEQPGCPTRRGLLTNCSARTQECKPSRG